MGKISVVVTVIDEEVEVLPRLLASVEKLADEVVVVDSTELLKVPFLKLKGLRVVRHKRVQYVELVRNFGVSKASGEWILVLDPDEEVSAKLAKKLKALVKNPSADYYRLPRKNIIFGRWIRHSRWWPDYNIRFFKKGHVSWDETIHKVPITNGRGLDLSPDEEFAIIHHHYNSIEQYVERMNRYTTAQARKYSGDFGWEYLITKPAGEFLSRYFKGQGYKDGIHGLALALLQSFSELVAYLKIWQKDKFRKVDLKVGDVIGVMKDVDRQSFYWRADSLVANGSLINRIKRKFKLR